MPNKVIIIGTLHAGITPNNELREAIESFKPDQLLVEMTNEDILKNDLTSYPPEMVFAYEWAKNNNVPVVGFDSKINVFKEGITPTDNQVLIEKQKKLMKNLSWKDFNKIENEKLLKINDLDEVIDIEKSKVREKELLKNINNSLIENGTVVIITGTAHLDFFQQNIDKAIFPFRD